MKGAIADKHLSRCKAVTLKRQISRVLVSLDFKNIKYAGKLPIKCENMASPFSSVPLSFPRFVPLCAYVFSVSVSFAVSLCPLVSVLCSGIYETNASVSHLVTHSTHTHPHIHTHMHAHG